MAAQWSSMLGYRWSPTMWRRSCTGCLGVFTQLLPPTGGHTDDSIAIWKPVTRTLLSGDASADRGWAGLAHTRNRRHNRLATTAPIAAGSSSG